MKQQAAKGPANLIDELAVAVTAPPDDEASGGGSISYADLHYSASSPGRARFKVGLHLPGGSSAWNWRPFHLSANGSSQTRASRGGPRSLIHAAAAHNPQETSREAEPSEPIPSRPSIARLKVPAVSLYCHRLKC